MLVPTTDQIEGSIRWWVALGSGLDPKYVQPGNSGRPAPNEPYATVLLINSSQPGRPWRDGSLIDHAGEPDDDMISETTVAVVRGRYSIQWYREGAADMAAQMRVWAHSSLGTEAALAGYLPLPRLAYYHGIDGPFVPFAVQKLSDPSRLDLIVADDYEERYVSQLDVLYQQSYTDTVERYVGADIIISDGYSPDITVSVSP